VCVFEPAAALRAATVLRAVARLAPRHPDLEVVLAGPGAGDEGLQMHAAALGIHHRLRAVDPSRTTAGHDARHAASFGAPSAGVNGNGHSAPARRPAPLAGAAVAWVVADGDDGAFGALDAMAAGVPVLADRGSAAARYVADAITGLHLTPGDVDGTAAALAQLLASDDTRHHMGAAGRARAARSYTEAAMLDGFARAAGAAAAARPRARAGA
jgi:glycosyltransferase involved in cell wall biosynthesis